MDPVSRRVAEVSDDKVKVFATSAKPALVKPPGVATMGLSCLTLSIQRYPTLIMEQTGRTDI